MSQNHDEPQTSDEASASDGNARQPSAPGGGDAVAGRQRAIQREQDARDAEKKQQQEQAEKAGGGKEEKQAVQAGAREHPAELPAQHLDKPGHEHELQLRPQFLAPDYKGSGKLDGMAAVVTGGD